ncbi:hypothetical protein [Paenibacillus roseipurpureus]|uniref:Uncharacterized protein n=1 Tax=Paenibacillus roseopurpureus TaxID=2918901 RepID=A0AA96LN97_9BACL|nr:hypothetical protein [Paenibacillus sp. MBLB1832]WNR43661.1 hypothetical protein MJB10_21550 [Paenibacillus sp. MBLB1832]
MMVNEYELVPHIEGTFYLKLNGVIIADYFYHLESEYDSLIQLDVCSHCYYPGCSDYGYLEVIDLDTHIAWKEPMKSKYSFSNRDFEPVQSLINGTIVWAKPKYNEFVSVLNQMNRSTIRCFGTRVEGIDILEIWRIEGSRLYSPGGFYTYDLDQIYQNRIGIYSEDLSEEQCEQIFNDNRSLTKFNKIEIIEISNLMKPIVMMFDVPIYKEWRCLYLLNEEVLFSIGEGLVARIS